MYLEDSRIGEMRVFLESFLVGLKLTYEGDFILELFEYKTDHTEFNDSSVRAFSIQASLEISEQKLPIVSINIYKNFNKIKIEYILGINMNHTYFYTYKYFDSIGELSKEIYDITERSLWMGAGGRNGG